MKKIEDFGQKIGLARKDIACGFTSSLIYEMNPAERSKFVKKEFLWPLPDAIKLVENGADPFVCYWQRRMRRRAKSFPLINECQNVNEAIEKFAKFTDHMNLFKNLVEWVRTEDDIVKFYDIIDSMGTKQYREALGDAISKDRVNATQKELPDMRIQCDKIGFPGLHRKGHERKSYFIPPQLEMIEREGKDYRNGKDVNDIMWQKTFYFRGVEFGNWLSQKDRQYSLNYAYDALMDLADVLGISPKDIAFSGRLALAFGARGYSSALAHYEPLREVINLTKMHGAGCTAHEWMHALDDRLAKHYGITSGHLASEATDEESELLPNSFTRLVKHLKFDENGQYTDFYRGSRSFDGKFAKSGHGYWASNCEMLARAFACYVKDTLGCKSDYLIAHADAYEFEYDDQEICAIPQGEEREILNSMFDQCLFEIKDIGFFKNTKPVSGSNLLPFPGGQNRNLNQMSM